MDYHSLQLSARRRYSAGLEMLASYTFGKTLTDNLGYYGSAFTQGEGAYWQNAYDRRANRGRAFFDARHNLSIGALYDLPFGKGKRFGSNMPKAAEMLLGGWNINTMVLAHSGFPITVRAIDRTSMAVRGNVRANYFRKLFKDESLVNIDNFFGLPTDTAARTSFFCPAGVDDGKCPYGNPGDGLFGTASIGTEQGPSFLDGLLHRQEVPRERDALLRLSERSSSTLSTTSAGLRRRPTSARRRPSARSPRRCSRRATSSSG